MTTIRTGRLEILPAGGKYPNPTPVIVRQGEHGVGIDSRFGRCLPWLIADDAPEDRTTGTDKRRPWM